MNGDQFELNAHAEASRIHRGRKKQKMMMIEIIKFERFLAETRFGYKFFGYLNPGDTVDFQCGRY